MFDFIRNKSSILAVAALVAVFASCYPNGPETVEEFDSVVTAVDPKADFGPLATFAIPDSVASITGDTGEEHDHSIDAQIIDRIRKNMTEVAGYTEIPLDLDNNPPDMLVIPGIAQFQNYNAYSTYPWYGGYGWYGGWNVGYPWYSSTVVYSYRVGTLVVLMVNGEDLDQDPENVGALWAGAANGLLADNPTGSPSRLNKAIDQMWTQSPYLRKDQ